MRGGLEHLAGAVLARRLQPRGDRPIAVALSGGGDSLFLLLIADAWANAHSRELLVLSVDHGLQAQSAAWIAQCATMAKDLNRPFQALCWRGDKPKAGLPAAARRARHQLLANAARAAGASVLLLGHTADDVLEAGAMRAAGSTTPDPREWAPSPVWPEGRGVFVLRPLLGLRRAEIREALRARNKIWIEDPANEDPRYARARARRSNPEGPAEPLADAPLALAGEASEALGLIQLPRQSLRQAAPAESARFLALGLVCAGGADRLPRAAQIGRLTERVRGAEGFVATLVGARLVASEGQVLIFRETGEARRGGLGAVLAGDGCDAVWDGRFLIPGGPGDVRRLHGLIRRLPRDQSAALARLPGPMRGGLPAIICGETATCLALDGRAQSLVGARFAAAAGLVDREPL